MIISKLIQSIKSSQTGNALIQIPVAAAIIASLALGTINATDILPQARDTRRQADVYQITQALAFYYDDNLTYPIYTGTDPDQSWQILNQTLSPNYIQELPNDPDENQSYLYWSDGQTAKIIYFSEISQTQKERWIY